MKTKRILLLLCVAAMSLSAPGASAAMRGSPMMGRPAMARSAMMRATPHFAPRNAMMGKHPFFNDRFHRFHHFNNQTFVFVDTLGFPFLFPYSFYPYPYYGDTIRTDTTGTAPTGTAVTGMGAPPALWKSSADLLAPATIMDASTASWGRKHAEQFALTNAITICAHTAYSIERFSQRWVSLDRILRAADSRSAVPEVTSV